MKKEVRKVMFDTNCKASEEHLNKEEFNLSEKDWKFSDGERWKKEKDVKEFISLVNEIILRPDLDVITKVEKVNKLAGLKLI